jgi:hypothetical protein
MYMDLYFEVDVFFVFVEDQFDKGVKNVVDGANVKQMVAIGKTIGLPRVDYHYEKRGVL